mmetsp:Transcript_75273/g.176664  ORF Transcript_75273/g.176664 Transcript_75273/m.176664 type:complete len:105 (+) Transcript_75273:134-448(+)
MSRSSLHSCALSVVEEGWDAHDSMFDVSSQVLLGTILQFFEQKGRDLFGSQNFSLAVDSHADGSAAIGVGNNLEWHHLTIPLHACVLVVTANQSLDIGQCLGRG